MHKLLPVLVLLASASTTIALAGGMGGGTGGGMGGAGMGGMGGAGMGGMTGGGMGGTGSGMGGMGAGMPGYGFSPGVGLGRIDAADPSGGGAQPAQYYLCITGYDRCSLAAPPGSLRSGSACTCSTGHTGKIK